MTRFRIGTPLRSLVKLGFLGVFTVACEAGAGLSRPAAPENAKARAVGLSIEEWVKGDRRFLAIASRAEVDLEPYRLTTGPVLAFVGARGETRGRRLVIEAESARLGEGASEKEFSGNVRVMSDGMAMNADKLVYDAKGKAVRLSGRAKSVGPRGRVAADRVTANLATDEATFEGNVRADFMVE